MFLLFGRRAKVKRKRGGRVERRRCPECETTCDFHEADEKESFHVFFVELYSGDDVVFVCSNCGEAMDLDATDAPTLSDRERKARAKAEAKERAKLEKERTRRAEAREKELAKREREVDDELRVLKERLRDE